MAVDIIMTVWEKNLQLILILIPFVTSSDLPSIIALAWELSNLKRYRTGSPPRTASPSRNELLACSTQKAMIE